jgi:hypothetical protein
MQGQHQDQQAQQCMGTSQNYRFTSVHLCVLLDNQQIGAREAQARGLSLTHAWSDGLSIT